MGGEAIILFTRVPVAGAVKTRLMGALSGGQCAALHAAFLCDVYEKCLAARKDVRLYYTGGSPALLPEPVRGAALFEQADGGLGEKMRIAFEETLREHRAAVLIGSDLPALTADILTNAFRLLEKNDAVIGPAGDGGYYLVGMKEYLPQLFSVKSYGGADVLAATEIAAKRAGITLVRAAECRDVDTPEDLELLAHGIISGKIRAPRTEAFLHEIGKIA